MSGIVLFPDALLKVAIRLGRTHVLAAAPTRVQILVETRPSAASKQMTAATDLRFVVDVSGSMAGSTRPGEASKLEVVKRAILGLLESLNTRDHVLLSVFSTQGKLIVPLTRLVNDSAKKRIYDAVQELQPDASTNISAGLELALTPAVATDVLPRVILFTDGQSSDPTTDHPRLDQLADLARTQLIPLSIYGTGSDYNWSLLLQTAARAGGGSFLKHVMDVQTLEGHMIAELAFLRGTAIDRFQIEGRVASADIALVGATALMPQIRNLELRNRNSFIDLTGAVDLHRGAQYLLEVEVPRPVPGETELLHLRFRGRNRTTGQRFEHTAHVPVTFVSQASQQSPVDEQVRKVLILLAAAKQAEAGVYDRAANLYRRGGDGATATVMEGLHAASQRPGADAVDLGREATTHAYGAATEFFTQVHKYQKGGS